MAELPLQGLRIIEPSQAWAIPCATKMLADMGAEVIKVETCLRLDSTRMGGAFPDNKPGKRYYDQGTTYTASNHNKMGITLDLTAPEGQNIFKELVKISDVVAENFTPRVLRAFGLDYPALREIKPDIIMVSSTGFGHTGPWASYGAYGWGLEPMVGISYLTGYLDGPPMRARTAYPDLMGALNASWAILAALEYRRRTGKGQWIDISQYETGAFVVGDAIMDYIVNGRVQTRMGNRHPSMAPHGCYRCKGDDRWVVIAVSTDEEWESLLKVMGKPSWSGDAKFATTLDRWQNQDELDKHLEEWTKSREHYEIMHMLQNAGVPAGAVLNDKELMLDPHLRDRQYYQMVTSADPILGTRPLMGPWFKLSETPGSLRKAAPTLGQHNRDVLVGLLHKTDEELAELERKGIIGTEPIGPSAGLTPIVTPLSTQKEVGVLQDYDEDYKDILGIPSTPRRDE